MGLVACAFGAEVVVGASDVGLEVMSVSLAAVALVGIKTNSKNYCIANINAKRRKRLGGFRLAGIKKTPDS